MKIEQLEEFIDRPSPQAGARMRIATPALIRVAKAAEAVSESALMDSDGITVDNGALNELDEALAELEAL